MAVFGKIRHTTIKGEMGTDWIVELYEKDFSGSSTDMTLAGEGFEITWNGQGSTRGRTFLGSECVFSLYVQSDADETLLYNILDSGFEKYFIRIYKNTTAAANLWWFGWIQPAFDVVENAPYPYISRITATDSYGYYDKKPINQFENEGSDNYSVVMDRNHNIADICVDFIKNMNLYTDATGDNHPFPHGTGEDFLRIAMDWTLAADYNNSPPPMERYFISKAAYARNKNFPREYKESEVFKDILKVFNLVGFLAEGKYYFFQPNKYVNNTVASNTFYGYDDISPVAYSGTIGTLNVIEINQTTNRLLGGSSFTYEAPLKSTKVTYESIPSYFFIPEGFEPTYGSDFTGGQLLNLDYQLKFDMTHTEEINLSTSTGGWAQSNQSAQYRIDATLFATTIDIEIKVSDGASNTKWLYVDHTFRQPRLEWSNSQKRIILHRGHESGYQPPVSLQSDWNSIWDINSSIGQTVTQNAVDGPGFMSESFVQRNTNAGFVEFKTNIVFEDYVPKPGFDNAVITINIDNPDMVLSQRGFDNPSGISGQAKNYTRQLSGGARQNIKGVINEFTFNRDAVASTEITEAVFTSTQTTNTAIEQLDLGGVIIGQSNDPKTSIRDTNKVPIISNFQVGNTSSTSAQLNKLLVDQFLKMQISPLQILQGNIQSSNISPLRVIKYRLTSNDSYNYYMFLGGTFKANSEIMEGEWFRVKEN